MKILVLSDVHSMISYAERIIEQEKPDEVFFCGDGLRDMQESAKFYPSIRFHFVAGNCDFLSAQAEQMITLEGKSIFLTHGHRYNVKLEYRLGYLTLRERAKALGADIVLFGHTHEADTCYRDGLVMMNPGAVNNGRYGVITIENGVIYPKLCRI